LQGGVEFVGAVAVGGLATGAPELLLLDAREADADFVDGAADGCLVGEDFGGELVSKGLAQVV
jgi:hypothetical protein